MWYVYVSRMVRGYPKYADILTRDHAFSYLDCLWPHWEKRNTTVRLGSRRWWRRGQTSHQCSFRQWFEFVLVQILSVSWHLVQVLCTLSVSSVLSLLPLGSSCSFFGSFLPFSSDQLAGWLLKILLFLATWCIKLYNIYQTRSSSYLSFCLWCVWLFFCASI